jgi:uncharacterized membrane protein
MVVCILFYTTVAIGFIWHHHMYGSFPRAFFFGMLAGSCVLIEAFVQDIKRLFKIKTVYPSLFILFQCAVCALIAAFTIFGLILE